MTTWRGQPVQYSVFNRKADTYSLVGDDGETVAELKRHEYLSNPQLRTLEHRNGRHRGAPAQNKRGAAGIASDPGRDDITSWWSPAVSRRPGAVYAGTIPSSPRPGLTIASILQAQRFFAGLPDELEKPPLKREGIVAGEIVGYRCWRVEGGLLRSVYQPDVWKPGEILEGRELGDWDSRGIHAWKDGGSKQYHDYIRGYLNRDDDPIARAFFFGRAAGEPEQELRPAMVTGTVFLWGDVVEHERGWRAEYARVRSLDWLYPDATMMGREQESLNAFRAKYGVLT